MKFLPNIILNFHAIKDPKWLENILLIIKRLYNPMSYEDLGDYYSKRKEIKHGCHITFDDGHISFYDTVFPLLQKYNIPASIFVSPNVISNRINFWFQEINDYDFENLNKIIDQHFMSRQFGPIPVKAKLKQLKISEIWDVIQNYQQITNTQPKSCLNMDLAQIKEIQQSGLINIGAHTMNHPILKNESDEMTGYEIGASIAELSTLLDTEINSFAYPNGKPYFDFGEREMSILKQHKIKFAFSTEERTLKINDNLLSIPRSGFEGGSTPYIYLKLMSGGNLNKLKKMMNKKDESSYRS